MSTGSAHLYHTTHPSSTAFPLNYHWPALRPKEGDTRASAKEAGNKPIINATLPLHCLPTWDMSRQTHRCLIAVLISSRHIVVSSLFSSCQPLVLSLWAGAPHMILRVCLWTPTHQDSFGYCFIICPAAVASKLESPLSQLVWQARQVTIEGYIGDNYDPTSLHSEHSAAILYSSHLL